MEIFKIKDCKPPEKDHKVTKFSCNVDLKCEIEFQPEQNEPLSKEKFNGKNFMIDL